MTNKKRERELFRLLTVVAYEHTGSEKEKRSLHHGSFPSSLDL